MAENCSHAITFWLAAFTRKSSRFLPNGDRSTTNLLTLLLHNVSELFRTPSDYARQVGSFFWMMMADLELEVSFKRIPRVAQMAVLNQIHSALEVVSSAGVYVLYSQKHVR
jgi:hypothetical protein